VTVAGKLSDDLAPGTLNSILGRTETMKLLIVIEKTRTGFSASSPDLQGCVATGETRKRVERNMQQAIEVHLAGMRAEKITVPVPRSYSTNVEVPA
jgi:predicted RNase H-like HicB family nuclease